MYYYFKNHILWFCFNRIYGGCECPMLPFQIYTTVWYQHKSSLLVLQFNWHIMISKVIHYNFISIDLYIIALNAHLQGLTTILYQKNMYYFSFATISKAIYDNFKLTKGMYYISKCPCTTISNIICCRV